MRTKSVLIAANRIVMISTDANEGLPIEQPEVSPTITMSAVRSEMKSDDCTGEKIQSWLHNAEAEKSGVDYRDLPGTWLCIQPHVAR